MESIRAAVLHGIGQPPRYELFPAPVAGDKEAIATVTAAALKPSDRLMAKAWTMRQQHFQPLRDLTGGTACGRDTDRVHDSSAPLWRDGR